MSTENNWLKLLIRSSMGLSGLKSRLQQFLVSFWVSCSLSPIFTLAMVNWVLHTLPPSSHWPWWTGSFTHCHLSDTPFCCHNVYWHTCSCSYSFFHFLCLTDHSWERFSAFQELCDLIETTQIIQNHFFISKIFNVTESLLPSYPRVWA